MSNKEKILAIPEKQEEMLEKHGTALGKLEAEQAETRDRLQKTAVTQEAVVLPRLDLLAEGPNHLAEILAPKSRAEQLEDEATLMKPAFRLLPQEVAELKKAQ